VTILCPIAQTAAIDPHAISLTDGEISYTYAELSSTIDQQVKRWIGCEIQPGSRVLLVATAEIASIVAFWSLLRLGAVACLASPRWPNAAMKEAAIQVGARWIVHAPSANSGAPYQIDSVAGSVLSPNFPMSADPQFRCATILFSSGSTGQPKAIVHTLDAHLANAAGANANLPLTASDRWLLSLPLFHVSGIGILFRCALASACVVIADRRWSLGEELNRHRPTHLSLVPTQLLRLIDSNRTPAGIRGVLLGGAPIPSSLLVAATDRQWPILTTYGLTEMASQVTCTQLGESLATLRTAGTVLAYRELRIDEHGEILVRGATQLLGYWHANRLHDPCTNDGWFATGDLGYLDSHQRLVVHGRRDNMFVSGGENIHPEAIERAMLEIPGVRQVIIVAVDDRDYGARPVAFVDAEVHADEAWRAWLKNTLPRFMVPDCFLPWQSPLGLKPDRRGLRQFAQEQLGQRGES
jgi:O-succinylbenzoic acid--CoA ligase